MFLVIPLNHENRPSHIKKGYNFFYLPFTCSIQPMFHDDGTLMSR